MKIQTKDMKNKTQVSDYKQAKEIGNSLEIFKDVTISVQSLSTFRKYLRDFSHGKQFVTKSIDSQLKVTRLS